jgi:hypothetical protein
MCINGMKTLKQDTSRYMQQASSNAWFAFSAVSASYSRNGRMSRFTELQVRLAYTSKVAATVAAARRTLADAVKVDAAEADGDGARAVESLPVPAGDVAEGADDEDDGDPPKNGAPEDGAGAGIMATSVKKFAKVLLNKERNHYVPLLKPGDPPGMETATTQEGDR